VSSIVELTIETFWSEQIGHIYQKLSAIDETRQQDLKICYSYGEKNVFLRLYGIERPHRGFLLASMRFIGSVFWRLIDNITVVYTSYLIIAGTICPETLHLCSLWVGNSIGIIRIDEFTIFIDIKSYLWFWSVAFICVLLHQILVMGSFFLHLLHE